MSVQSSIILETNDPKQLQSKMLMFAAVAALAVAANAQVLRISPAIIGSSAAGSQQVINLGLGGSKPAGLARASGLGRIVPAAPKPAAYAVVKPAAYAVVKPVAVAQAIRPAYAQVQQEAPAPFAFAFDSEDEFGTKLGRQETANEQGVVNGQYSFSDASGILRVVKYVADENGFRADVETNEPGTLTSNPADVQIKSSAQ